MNLLELPVESPGASLELLGVAWSLFEILGTPWSLLEPPGDWSLLELPAAFLELPWSLPAASLLSQEM